MRGSDWAALYQLTDESVRSSTSKEEFVRFMRGFGKVDAIDATGPTAYTTTSTGIAYAKTPTSPPPRPAHSS